MFEAKVRYLKRTRDQAGAVTAQVNDTLGLCLGYVVYCCASWLHVVKRLL